MLTVGCLCASAQEAKTVEKYNPHWYVQAQAGMQHTLGEIDDVNSPNIQIAAGYNFNKYFGLRLAVGAWQSKGGVTVRNTEYKYKWNYVAPALTAHLDLTNALFGFNPKRIVDFGVFAGVALNIGFNNGEAADIQSFLHTTYPEIQPAQAIYMGKLWTGTKVKPVGQFGANLDFNVSRRVKIGVEANCNFLSDSYNSKRSSNVDWYFNVLAGVKVALGKTTKKVPVEPVLSATTATAVANTIEKIVEKHDTIYIEKQTPAESIRRDIFFTITKHDISSTEMKKVEDLAQYLNKYPKAKITITGYADKGTGHSAINSKYARNRAEIVAKVLKEKFGISADRITVDSKGDTEQPYSINELNRVSICIAE